MAEIIRRMGVSEQTSYRWRKVYGGLGVGELRRVKQIEDENRKLKQLVVDLSAALGWLTPAEYAASAGVSPSACRPEARITPG